MSISEQNSLKGHFLIAMPGLIDPNFHQTVTFICEHTHEGAMGIIIDRRVQELTSGRIFDELGIACLQERADLPVYFGGPVHVGELFILHGPPFHWEGCLEISPEFGLSNTTDILESIAMGRGPEEFIIAVGCSGWGAGQLEGELKENAWLTGRATTRIVFNTTAKQRWAAAVENLGIDPDLLSGEAGHA
jgi:putative transcriptional regulator